MTALAYIDGVKTPGATPDAIRQAVAAGKSVVLRDDTGITIQVDKAMLARIDRRNRFKPCTTTSKNPPASPN